MRRRIWASMDAAPRWKSSTGVQSLPPQNSRVKQVGRPVRPVAAAGAAPTALLATVPVER